LNKIVDMCSTVRYIDTFYALLNIVKQLNYDSSDLSIYQVVFNLIDKH